MTRVLNLRLAPLPGQQGDDVVLPAEVRTLDGGLLSRVLISSKGPVAVELPDDLNQPVGAQGTDGTPTAPQMPEQVTVAARMPFGEEVRRRVNIEGPVTDCEFALKTSSHEWLGWAATRLNLAKTVDLSFDETPAYKVWGKLWTLEWGTWRPKTFEPQAVEGDRYARQFEVLLGEPTLLQLGGPQFAIRFVSLPRGRVRILLTPNPSTSPNADPLKIVVSTVGATNEEMLLSLIAADALMTAEPLARELAKRFNWSSDALRKDPVPAFALGYSALKLNARDLFTLDHARSLCQMAPDSPDAAILLASRELAEGTNDLSTVLNLYDVGLGQALPVLAEAMRAAHEGLVLLSLDTEAKLGKKLLSTLSARAGRYMSARAWAGPFFSFYGPEPLAPSAQRYYGESSAEVVRDVSRVAKDMGKNLLTQTGGWEGLLKRAVSSVVFLATAKAASKLLIESEPRPPDTALSTANSQSVPRAPEASKTSLAE